MLSSTQRSEDSLPSGAVVSPEDTRYAGCAGARFVLCRDWMLESEHEAHVTVVNSATARRLKLSRPLYRFVLLFRSPCRIEDLALTKEYQHFIPIRRDLLDKGLLVNADVPHTSQLPKLRARTPCTFCNSPLHAPETRADFVVLGVPYDLGGDLECRTAPSSIRRRSLDFPYGLHIESRRPLGWQDVNGATRILEGASLADAGDVYVEYGESQRDLFDRIGRVLTDICRTGAIPVVLGGDRSVTFALADYLRRQDRLTVAQLTASPAASVSPAEAPVTSDTVGTRLTRLANIDSYVAVGAIREGEDAIGSFKNLLVRSASSLQEANMDALARDLGAAANVHLSIDLSVLQSEYVLNPDGTARGLAFHQIKELIRAIGTSRRIVGIDLVGLDTRSDSLAISSIAACHLALIAMNAARSQLR